jgi:hypothetical protein
MPSLKLNKSYTKTIMPIEPESLLGGLSFI